MNDVKEIARKIYHRKGYYAALQCLKEFKVVHVAYNILLEIKQEELIFETIAEYNGFVTEC